MKSSFDNNWITASETVFTESKIVLRKNII